MVALTEYISYVCVFHSTKKAVQNFSGSARKEMFQDSYLWSTEEFCCCSVNCLHFSGIKEQTGISGLKAL